MEKKMKRCFCFGVKATHTDSKDNTSTVDMGKYYAWAYSDVQALNYICRRHKFYNQHKQYYTLEFDFKLLEIK